MVSKTDHRKIIESYGYLTISNQRIDGVLLSPSAMLESKTKITRLYGHGNSHDEALSDLYRHLYRAIDDTVKSIENKYA
mgnify:CR=1 FL=1